MSIQNDIDAHKKQQAEKQRVETLAREVMRTQQIEYDEAKHVAELRIAGEDPPPQVDDPDTYVDDEDGLRPIDEPETKGHNIPAPQGGFMTARQRRALSD